MIYVPLNVLSKNVPEISSEESTVTDGKAIFKGTEAQKCTECDSVTHCFSKAIRDYCAGVCLCVCLCLIALGRGLRFSNP